MTLTNTHKVHPVLSQPVEALKEKQEGEEGYEAGGEVIPEHSECQARLGHCIPGALNEMLVGEERQVYAHKPRDWSDEFVIYS